MRAFVSRRLRSTGFTLLELLVTITILVILTVAAVPSMSKMMQRNRIINTANEIVTAAKFAQNEAIIRKERIIMAIDPNDLHHWVIYVAPRDQQIVGEPIPDELVRELWLDKGLELVPDKGSFGPNKRLQFLPNGTISGLVVGSDANAVGHRIQGRFDHAAAVAVCSKRFPEETIDVRLGGLLRDVGARTIDTTRRQNKPPPTDCSAPLLENWQPPPPPQP